MDPQTVAAVIGAARSHWDCADDIEITLEANPNSVEAARFADLAAAGVNRLSLGLQSFHDRDLAFLGRAHSAAEGLAALDTAQHNFDRVSFDLIYALPGDDEAKWAADLDRALALGTTHLSLYQLTIEPGTRFASDVAKGRFEPLGEEQSASLFELTQERSAEAGMPAYEISNHAAPGAESRHNLTYWRYGDYAGIGPGAHGRRLGMRTLRHRKPENFLSAIKRGGNGLVEEAPLTPTEAADEALVMGLRLSEGSRRGRARGTLRPRPPGRLAPGRSAGRDRPPGSGSRQDKADAARAPATRSHPRRDCRGSVYCFGGWLGAAVGAAVACCRG